ncbi:MAG: polysaccharide deacetylase family protein [Deltaproteobacteria bacterium]|nr:polysaccharide deacetylase family protein [Deltaproteobacteria bacterium]
MNWNKDFAPLWRQVPSDIEKLLDKCLEEAAAKLQPGGSVIVFFRADDIGVPGEGFARLVNLFRHHRAPLTLSVVPAWLTRPRWQQLQNLCGKNQRLWCWTQHGWRHLNHEPRGKKMEFGPSRKASLKRQDLWLGYQRLRKLMGEIFVPAFTPPWNRCDLETLTTLQDLGYQALSRSLGVEPVAPVKLAEYPVSVDLHTRKEPDAYGGWQSLLHELKENLAVGFCGVMIHHQRMNQAAFIFLDLLLNKLKRWQYGRLVHMGTLLEADCKVLEGRC